MNKKGSIKMHSLSADKIKEVVIGKDFFVKIDEGTDVVGKCISASFPSSKSKEVVLILALENGYATTLSKPLPDGSLQSIAKLFKSFEIGSTIEEGIDGEPILKTDKSFICGYYMEVYPSNDSTEWNVKKEDVDDDEDSDFNEIHVFENIDEVYLYILEFLSEFDVI